MELNFSKRPDSDRRIRQSERIARVLRILNLIQSRGRWNAQAIAQELECSVRTVHRDLQVLEFVGVPWYYDETDNCYRIRADHRFPVLNLKEEELLGQVLATTLTRPPGIEIDINLGAGPTTKKLLVSANESSLQIVDDAARLIEVLDLKLADHSRHREMISTIQSALLSRKRLVGLYESPYEPHVIKQAWYLIGRLHDEDVPKTFRAMRFKSLRMIEEDAEIPTEFDLRSYLGNAWSVYRGEQTYDIELRFEKLAGRIASETQWYPTQRVKQHRDGRMTISFQVDGLSEILRWILSWSGNVKVMASELKILVLDALEQGIQINSRL